MCGYDICQRCLRELIAINADDDLWCPNCGLVTWLWKYDEPLRIQTTTNGGHFPVASREQTGYFIDNPNPLAGLREPAMIWIEGKQ
jgi:hypothetical protein